MRSKLKSMLTMTVLVVMAMTVGSCERLTAEEIAAAEASASPGDLTPSPSGSPTDDATPTTLTSPADEKPFMALIGDALGIDSIFAPFSPVQCIDASGAAPVETDCVEVSTDNDCAVVFLSDGGPFVVACEAIDERWGVDIGYEGAYTTAAGERGEFGLSCRVSMIDDEGLCTTEIAGQTIEHEPQLVVIGEHRGLALLAPPDADDDVLAALGELRVTTGLEAVVRASFVTYEADSPSDQPDLLWLGVNALTSLDQNAAIIDSVRAEIPESFLPDR